MISLINKSTLNLIFSSQYYLQKSNWNSTISSHAPISRVHRIKNKKSQEVSFRLKCVENFNGRQNRQNIRGNKFKYPKAIINFCRMVINSRYSVESYTSPHKSLLLKGKKKMKLQSMWQWQWRTWGNIWIKIS